MNKKPLFLVIITFLFIISCHSNQEDGITIEKILHFPEKTENKKTNYYDKEYLKELDIRNKKGEYSLILSGYAYSPDKDAYYNVYRSSFLDEKGNFIKGTPKNIEDFLVYEKVMDVGLETFYKEIDNLEKVEKKEPKLAELDKYVQDWINVLREERTKIKEIRSYYETGEYKKDDYSKGKVLNDEYLKILYKRKQIFRTFNKKVKEEDYEEEKTIISNSISDDNLYMNLRKLNLLMGIFDDRLYDWNEISIGKNEKFNVDINNQKRYRAELELILTEVEKQLKKTKELTTDSKIHSMHLKKDMYIKILEQGDKGVELSKKILDKIDNKNYDNLNALAVDNVVNTLEMYINIRQNLIVK